MAAGEEKHRFEVEKADLTVQVNFASRLWELVERATVLYERLLQRLGEDGVRLQDIRVDNGDGSLAGFNVNFWMFDVRVVAHIYLDRLELSCGNVLLLDIDQIERVFVRLTEVLSPSVQFSSYGVTLNFHGQLDGLPAKDYLSNFVTKVPEGVGPVIGSGVNFYFGERPPCTLSTLTLDLSGVLPDRLYVRQHFVFDGQAIAPEELRRSTGEQLSLALAAVNLYQSEPDVSQ